MMNFLKSYDWRFWESYRARFARFAYDPKMTIWLSDGSDRTLSSAGLLTRLHWRGRHWFGEPFDWRFWERYDERELRLYHDHCCDEGYCEWHNGGLKDFEDDAGFLTKLNWKLRDWITVRFHIAANDVQNR